jgi:hypothetical protein
LDERLRPVKIDHPFKSSEDADLFEIEGARNLAEDSAPVKYKFIVNDIESVYPKTG